MKLFNTLTRQKEEFKEIKEGTVTMYACGPTVYDFFHIGNARPFITFDVLRRYFEFTGKKVRFVQNFTDIDDKMIKRANAEGITVKELGDRFIEEYYKDAGALGVGKATVHPRATECIDDIIKLVSTLVEKGMAYEVDGDVFYRTTKFPDYGKLSHYDIEELESGARIEINDKKEDPLDFVIWKSAKPGEPYWESPWGIGRPGWHIECSAMANKYLGKTIDIHCGGVDLIFPHHENEIAQSEAANGAPFAHYWLHNGHINVDNRKMSKSLGNFFTVREAADVYGYETIRFFMLSSHYRSPINYSLEVLTSAKGGLERLYTAKNNLEFAIKSAKTQKMTEDEAKALAEYDSFRTAFCEKMDDDLNTADAVSVIFDMVRKINSEKEGGSAEFYTALLSKLKELCGVLNILNKDIQAEVPEEIQKLVDERTEARKNKDFAKADEIRAKLTEMGVILEDTKDGVKILIKK
ncbi:MAG: cysteine--tRNA ligase [Clostridia bacterium]|nr:cysteine--tRNA ligase [Clostridia bacterium]